MRWKTIDENSWFGCDSFVTMTQLYIKFVKQNYANIDPYGKF